MTPPGDGAAVDLEPLLETSRAINAVIVSSLAAVDTSLTVPQLRVLVIVSGTPRASLSDVAGELGLDLSNVSRTCDQLVRRGLLVRTTDADDRRRRSLQLSAAGRRLLRRVMERRRRLLAGIVAAMPVSGQQDLMDALAQFNEAARQVGTTDPGGRSPRALPWVE